jgi:hypothetical protein
MDRVVPFAVKCVGLQIDVGEFFVCDPSPDGVLAVIEPASHCRALGRRRSGDQPHYRLALAQRLPSPVGRDEREQPVLHLVPFARPRREMAACQRQPRLVGQALQLPFPQPPAVAAAAVAVISNCRTRGFQAGGPQRAASRGSREQRLRGLGLPREGSSGGARAGDRAQVVREQLRGNPDGFDVSDDPERVSAAEEDAFGRVPIEHQAGSGCAENHLALLSPGAAICGAVRPRYSR